MIDELKKLTGLEIYPASLTEEGGVTYFLGRRGSEKLVGSVGKGKIRGDKWGKLSGKPVFVGPTDHANAVALRKTLPWTGPRTLGLATSVGCGDRLGMGTPGHIRAVKGSGLLPVLAQQSIREMTRTQRMPEQVIDCATWGVFQEGYKDGWGSDGDHIQQLEALDNLVNAGFTMYTIDPGPHVVNEADSLDAAALAKRYAKLDYKTFGIPAEQLKALYAGKSFPLAGGGSVGFDELAFLRAAVKYGNAITHIVKMYRRLQKICKHPFELEVSVDETESVTSPAEHYFFAAELKRMGVTWSSMAPRFMGRFEKGVDYIGDLDAFGRSFAEHVAVMRTLGPYKISIHSGSDKFSIYPIVAQATGGLVHLKTAGTSWLEAVRAVAKIDPGLFREIYEFARERYDTDKASYHVSGDMSKVPPASALSDAQLPDMLDDFHARQMLHVTFGSILTAEGSCRFRPRFYAALQKQEEVHYDVLARHIGRHVAPFAKK
ncbi:MAG: tagaturonate epimerase family protein [Phycisphaerae bacterium]